MRIKAIAATAVRVPRLTRLLPKTAHGEVRASEYVVIEVRTDNGLIGLGEVTCAAGWSGETAADSIRLLSERLEPALSGTDPCDRFTLAETLTRYVTGRPFLAAAIEMACLDLEGQDTGRPVGDLLGGVVRSTFTTKMVLPARRPDEVATMAADALSMGVAALKVKVGLDPAEDVHRVQAVREVAGFEIPLTVDANEGWTLSDARKALEALNDTDLLAVEQPLPRHEWEAMAELRTEMSPHFIGDESIWTQDDLAAAAHHGSFDGVSIYPGKVGSLAGTVELAHRAAQLGLEVSFGSNLELGIGASALAHTMAAIHPTPREIPSDLIGPLYFESPLITDASFVGWSSSCLPAGSGLGVELDRRALNQYAFQP